MSREEYEAAGGDVMSCQRRSEVTSKPGDAHGGLALRVEGLGVKPVEHGGSQWKPLGFKVQGLGIRVKGSTGGSQWKPLALMV